MGHRQGRLRFVTPAATVSWLRAGQRGGPPRAAGVRPPLPTPIAGVAGHGGPLRIGGGPPVDGPPPPPPRDGPLPGGAVELPARGVDPPRNGVDSLRWPPRR